MLLFLKEAKKEENYIARGEYKGSNTNSPSDNTMLVHAGSKMVKHNRLRKPQCIKKRKEIMDRIRYDKDYYVLSEDVEFSSPSLAAAVILGKECNGLRLWENDQGTVLKNLAPSAHKS